MTKIIIAPELEPTQQIGGSLPPYVAETTAPLELVPTTPHTLDVLRHIRSTYGLDAPQMPLAVVTEELDTLINTIEMYQNGTPIEYGEIAY